MRLKKLTEIEFNALVKCTQFADPIFEAQFLAGTKEVEFWANADETALGVLIHDIPDADYNGVILTRDERGVFRSFDSTLMSPDKKAASAALQERLNQIIPEDLTEEEMQEAFYGAVDKALPRYSNKPGSRECLF
jgi:hypothetical protein